MKRIFILLFILAACSRVTAQIVSSNAFLKGNFVEVGMAPCGSFGTTVNAPTGYHPRTSPGSPLGFVADPGLDGWNVGFPDYVGDYFLPGSSEEGWGIAINNSSYNNNLKCTISDVAGSIINYTSTPTEVSATWQGTKNGLSITARTYIPINSAYFVTEVTLTNTSSATLKSIFYMRNVDPDHGVFTPGAGGLYQTNNSVVYQNPNVCNRALVTATTLQGNHYLGLGSLDPRARVTHGGFNNRLPANVWNGGGSLNSSGTLNNVDEAISISFKVDSLQANQTTKFAYAYILSASQLEDALAATNINFNVNGVTFSSGSATTLCASTAIPISLNNAGASYTWSWSPSTGLNTTTGTNVIATISTPVTYTVTGTSPCGTVTLNLTLNPISIPAPGNAGAITGPANILLGQTGNTFSVPVVPNATTYNWVLPPGSVVTSGAGTNAITFNASNTLWCGPVSVTPTNVCATGGSATLNVCLVSILTNPVPATFCIGSTITIPFSVTSTAGYFLPGNVFTAQLSDAAGSFAAPVNIGTTTGTSGGTITGVIPMSTVPGIHYRIRVISSTPADIGPDNGSDLFITSTTPGVTVTTNVIPPVCAGTPVTFTAVPVNGGSAPGYQWKKNGINVGTNSATYTDATLTSTDVVTVTMTSSSICVLPATATSTGVSIAINPVLVPSVSFTSSLTGIICQGATPISITFTATPVNGGTTPVYQWKKNGVNVGTNSPVYTGTPMINGDVVTVTMTSNAVCAAPSVVTSAAMTIVIAPTVTPTVSITSSTSSYCSGVPATFTAVPVNGGAAPSYDWKINGITVTSGPAPTFTTSILTNGDVVSVQLTSNAPCTTTTTATSNTIAIALSTSVIPGVNINLSTPLQVCAGTPVTFTSNIIGGGTTPSYRWERNGTTVGTNTPTYTDNTLVTGDSIQVILTSSVACATIAHLPSNKIGLTFSPLVVPSVHISAFPGTSIAEGQSVTFAAIPTNGGTNPAFQWYKNAQAVFGATNSNWVTNTLVNGDVISVQVISNAACPQPAIVRSNLLRMEINKLGIPGIKNGQAQIALYPTPNNGQFTLSLTGNTIGKKIRVEIMNTLGQIVYSAAATPDRKDWTLNISLTDQIANGIYTLKVVSEEMEGVQRFEVRR